MESLNILHISDAHIQKKDKNEIKTIVEKMLNDILRIQKEQNIKINLICFTGDLIQRGDKALQDEMELEIADEILVQPLLNGLGLEKRQFIVVPGNHEVDITKITKATEKGLLVNSLDDINENINDMDESYLKRLRYFYDAVETSYEDIIKENIGYAFIREIAGKKIGIVCLDSAWRSSGKGSCEKGLMYVGQKQVQDLFKHIKDTDFKICMMHHPLDWLSDYESTLIEKEMTKFDMVLNGHVHLTDNKEICRQKIKTIYSTAGKLYPLDYAYGHKVDGYNGYSVLNINFATNLCTIFMRTYYAMERNDFDIAVNIDVDGKRVYPLNGNTEEKQMEYNIVNGIKEYFRYMSETFTLLKEIDTHSPASLNDVFVEPILSEESEYMKEKGKNSTHITLEQLVNENENIILFGKKESGKTTLLQKIGLLYIDKYEKNGMIPIHIDMRKLPKKNEKLTNATIYFVMNNMFDDADINKAKVKELIKTGKFVFLIDNVDISDDSHTNMLTKFIQDSKDNQFFLTVKEEFFQSIDIKKLPEYCKNFKKIYIHFMGKAQIRELVTRWADKREDAININEVVEKIDGYCNQINFAKTPFNVSIFMVLWDSDKNFIPQNEGIVMQNYLEILLEKLSPDEGYRSTYSFQIKEHFLSNMAYRMFEKNQYYFTKDEFYEYLHDYHKVKGYIEENSRFSELFFEKGILSLSDDMVIFSHTSILEYYLAVYAINNEDFFQYILKKGNRVNFRNELCFYSGLKPNCGELLDSMAETIIETIIDSIDVVEDLNKLEIMVDFRLKKDELVKSLTENRPTQKEIDNISDLTNKMDEVSPLDIPKKKKRIKIEAPKIADIAEGGHDEKETEDFYSLLQMYGSVLKNAELLDNNLKINHLENYMYAMNILLREILQVFEIAKEKISVEDMKKAIGNMEELPSEEEFENVKGTFMEMMKVTVPIAIQNMILENVGTPKMEIAINELMANKLDKPFEKFMLVFLKCDLKIGNPISELKRYVQCETSDSILKLIMLKLIFYYRMRFFGVDPRTDNSLLDLIIEIQMKLNSNQDVALAIKGNRALARKTLAKELQKK